MTLNSGFLTVFKRSAACNWPIRHQAIIRQNGRVSYIDISRKFFNLKLFLHKDKVKNVDNSVVEEYKMWENF